MTVIIASSDDYLFLAIVDFHMWYDNILAFTSIKKLNWHFGIHTAIITIIVITILINF